MLNRKTHERRWNGNMQTIIGLGNCNSNKRIKYRLVLYDIDRLIGNRIDLPLCRECMYEFGTQNIHFFIFFEMIVNVGFLFSFFFFLSISQLQQEIQSVAFIFAFGSVKNSLNRQNIQTTSKGNDI